MLASRLLSQTQQHQHNYYGLARSTIRRQTSTKTKWPSVHPKKKRLQQLKNVLHGKDPNTNLGPVPEPTKHQLYVVALHQAIPFVGFGIMDNAILLLAGEAIDVYLGVTLGISTMCAAAIGNIISDLSGVALGTMIEDALLGWSKKMERLTGGKVKLPPMPKLSYEQRNLRSVRLSGQMGCAAGLTVGCVIGMFPLLFFPEDERAKKETENDQDGSASKKLINEQNEQLKKEISQWKEKHDEVKDRMRVLEREKNDGLWDKGY
ncbi:hypothetical protein ACHAXR_008568 [Thalassiosira sp. AJA248-18]